MLCEIYLCLVRLRTKEARQWALSFIPPLLRETIIHRWILSINLFYEMLRVTSSYVGKEDKKSVVQKVFHNLMEVGLLLKYFTSSMNY